MLALNERVTSVDVPLGAESERTVLDTIADVNQADPAESLIDNDLRGNIDRLVVGVVREAAGSDLPQIRLARTRDEHPRRGGS